MNRKFSRTVEKVLAWLANVILIIATCGIGIVVFSGLIQTIWETPGFKQELRFALLDSPQFAAQYGQVDDQFLDQLFFAMQTGAKVYFWIVLAILVFAIIASVSMKHRIFSGVLFIILAIATFIFSFAFAFFLYVPYLIVGIMLFARKEPKNDDFNTQPPYEQVEKVEYV